MGYANNRTTGQTIASGGLAGYPGQGPEWGGSPRGHAPPPRALWRARGLTPARLALDRPFWAPRPGPSKKMPFRPPNTEKAPTPGAARKYRLAPPPPGERTAVKARLLDGIVGGEV